MRTQITRKMIGISLCLHLVGSAGCQRVPTADWPHWRGPLQTGVSLERGLISNWSLEDDNLIWKADFIGRSTPVVLNGRVYVTGRIGKEITEQEQIACFDAQTGKLLWEHRFNVFHTTIPFNRVGWASPAGDPETGNIYVHGVGGLFFCFDRDGNILWSRSLTEELGRISGYGGRVHTPFVDGDLVIISFLNSSWGDQVPGRHRYYAFDKRTGEVVWISTPGGPPKDTTYSTPVVAVINGQRLLIAGNANGAIYALKVQTGEKVWEFQLSKRDINASVVVDGNRVYAGHSEENLDNTSMGRVVCIDATGTGDVTKTHEIWRYDECRVGYASPAVHAGRLYVVDNSANLHCLDAENGTVYWHHNVGTVGKGSPVWADGKLYVTEVNGAFQVVQAGKDAGKALDQEKIRLSDGRPAEIYGSPAVAYGRIYFTTEEGLYCLGDKKAAFTVIPSKTMVDAGRRSDRNAPPAAIRVVPAEVLVRPGETVRFNVRTFDAQGRFIRSVNAAWSLKGLLGEMDGEGRFTPDKKQGAQAGFLFAQVEDLKGSARVRVVPPLPWSEDFESVEVDKNPAHWVGAGTRFLVKVKDGNRVLVKAPVKRGLNRSNVYLGPPGMANYTIQADLMGTKKGRRRSDMGLIANRYTLDMMGNHQRLQVRSWASDLRMARTIDFQWHPDVWYTMKLKVDVVGQKAIVKGKVWRTSDPEPEAWTITAEDPLPNREGSPGLYGYSPVEIYYDNIKVMED